MHITSRRIRDEKHPEHTGDNQKGSDDGYLPSRIYLLKHRKTLLQFSRSNTALRARIFLFVTRERVDVPPALKSFEVACRVILRGRVGVENGELEVGFTGLT
jgi:hypothetical protein